MGLRLHMLLPLLLLASLAGGYLTFYWAPGYVADDMQARRGLLLAQMEFLHHELLEHVQQGHFAEVHAHLLALLGTYPDVRRINLNDPDTGIELSEGVSGTDLRSTGIEALVIPSNARPQQSTPAFGLAQPAAFHVICWAKRNHCMALISSIIFTVIAAAMTVVVAFGDLGSDITIGRRLKAVATGILITLVFAAFAKKELRWRKEDLARKEKKRDIRARDWKGDLIE